MKQRILTALILAPLAIAGVLFLPTSLFMVVMAAFLFWFGRLAVRAWRRQRTSGGTGARAASLVIGLLLAHSLVDYPLRSPAMMCVFALACGLMLAPRAGLADPQD